MVTAICPDEQPEQPDWKPRVKLDKPLLDLVGAIGWSEAVRMYMNPYTLYPEPPTRRYEPNCIPRPMGSSVGRAFNWSYLQGVDWKLNAYEALLELGMIAANEEGYQLTADGRYYVAKGLAKLKADDERLKRQFEREEREYYAHSHMDVW